MSYVKRIIQLVALCDTYKDDNRIFKNNRDRWWISYWSKHQSFVKLYRLVASAVKLKYCGLSPFYKIEKICSKDST